MDIKTVVLYILATAPNSIIILQDPREKLQVETLCAQKMRNDCISASVSLFLMPFLRKAGTNNLQSQRCFCLQCLLPFAANCS